METEPQESTLLTPRMHEGTTLGAYLGTVTRHNMTLQIYLGSETDAPVFDLLHLVAFQQLEDPFGTAYYEKVRLVPNWAILQLLGFDHATQHKITEDFRNFWDSE